MPPPARTSEPPPVPSAQQKLFSKLPADVFAGLTVASILLPEAVAFAAIAHLSIQAAIVATLAGLFAYAILGGSRFAVVAPTSSSAALMAAAVLSLHPLSAAESTALSMALVLVTGLGLLALAAARLGRLAAFVSRPVLRGFSFALALTIIIKQLPGALGVSVSAANPLPVLLKLLEVLPHWSLNSALLSVGSLALFLLLKRWPRLPGALLVLAFGIILAYRVDLAHYGIASVGDVPLAMPSLSFPDLDSQRWIELLTLAGGMLVIVFSESWGSVRSLALLRNDPANPDRELFALGSSNILSGLLQGMPVGAGFSASMVSYSAGAASKLTGVFTGLLVLLLAVFGKALIEHIPQPVLAVAVISTLLTSLNPHALLQLWRLNRDQYLALSAVLAVLTLGVLHGMMVAIFLSLLAAMRSFSEPVVSELAEMGESRNFIARHSHPDTQVWDHVLVLRPEEPLFFGSAEAVMHEVSRRVRERPGTHALVLSLEQSADLDSTAAELLLELANLLDLRGTTLLLARCKDPVRTTLLKLAPELFRDRLFWSVADATASRKPPPGP